MSKLFNRADWAPDPIGETKEEFSQRIIAEFKQKLTSGYYGKKRVLTPEQERQLAAIRGRYEREPGDEP